MRRTALQLEMDEKKMELFGTLRPGALFAVKALAWSLAAARAIEIHAPRGATIAKGTRVVQFPR